MRSYTGLADLARMERLQSTIKGSYPNSSYHPGDLNWWFFYGDSDKDLSQYVYLWERADGELDAWAFCDKDGFNADAAFHPDLRGTDQQRQILIWIETHLSTFARARGGAQTVAIHTHTDETARIQHLEARGYTGSALYVCFAQNIRAPRPAPALPDGFTFLEHMRPEDAENRAAVHFHAFSPRSKMTAARYRHFMTAPRYNPWLDVVVVALDGTFAAYAMAWVDDESKVGIFEPVGTHPNYRRRGLGRAALLEGIRRMQASGMEVATVNTNADNNGNIAFYLSAGFTKVNEIQKLTKPITP